MGRTFGNTLFSYSNCLETTFESGPRYRRRRNLALSEHILVNTLLMAFDLGGTFVLALSGATAGVKHRLDLFGVLVLSFAAGNSGGTGPEPRIGAAPPFAISGWRDNAC